jgi:hypothetical protein
MATRKPPEPPVYTGNLRSRFVPLAESRMNTLLAAMDYLGDLAQRNRYHYTDLEWARMHRVLTDKVAELDATFKEGKGNRPKFRFSEPEED